MKRKVTTYKFTQSGHSVRGTGTNTLTLECGHESYQGASKPVPPVKNCLSCDHLSSGGLEVIGCTLESWNSITLEPVRTEFSTYAEASKAMDEMLKKSGKRV